MVGSSRPSFSVPSEPNLRRLGTGSGGGGGDRPLRAQAVVFTVAILTLLGIPLYLLGRPSGKPAAGSDDPDAGVELSPAIARSILDAGAEKAEVKLGPVQRVKCSPSKSARGNEGSLCDALPVVEQALSTAIRENVGCAPKTGKEGTINFVLEVDFTRRSLNVFPGASGQWRGPQSKRAAQCVERSLPQIQWDAIAHQYRFYMVAVMATYPAPNILEGFPEFE